MTVKLLRAFWELFRDTILEIQSKHEKHEMAKEKQNPDYSKSSTEMKNTEKSADTVTRYFTFTKLYFLLGVKDMNEKMLTSYFN